MPIRLTCPYCQIVGTIPDDSAGRLAKCPECGKRFHVPGGTKAAAEQTVTLSVAVAEKVNHEPHPRGPREWRCPKCGGSTIQKVINGADPAHARLVVMAIVITLLTCLIGWPIALGVYFAGAPRVRKCMDCGAVIE